MNKLKIIPVTKDIKVGLPTQLVSKFKTQLLLKMEGFETPLIYNPSDAIMTINLYVFGINRIEIWGSGDSNRVLKVFWEPDSNG